MRLKVGLYIPTLSGGGAQRVALNLAQGLVSNNCDVSLILVKLEGRLRNEIPAEVNLVDLDAARTLTSVPKLAFHLWRAQYDVVISFMNYVNLYAVVASILSKSTHDLILTEHSTFSRSLYKKNRVTRWIRLKLVQYLYPIADHITAVSRGATEDLQRTVGLQDVCTIPNPISVHEPIQTTGIEGSTHPWFAEPGPVVLGAGRLTDPKGFSTLVRSLTHIRNSGLNARLVIIGEGEKRSHLEGLARKMDIYEYVCLPGFVDNPYEFMQGADVFVLSSKWEGFGNVLVEAMACGTPVVSTDCPNGPSEILEGGRFGHLVPVEDDEALAQAIIDTLDAPPAASDKLTERAKTFSPKKIARRYLALYSE